MARIVPIALVLLLTACAGHDNSRAGSGLAGLDVARAALAGGSPEIALNVTNAILASKPDDVPALVSQGDAFSALGRSDDAQASYAKALAGDPESVEAQIGLGRLRLNSDPAQAQLLFLKVLQHDPRNTVALNDLGIAYDLQAKHDSAQVAYRQALGADPTMRAAEVNLALSMALSGQAPAAVALLKPLAIAPDASRRLRHDLAVALAMAGDKPAAAQILGADMAPEEVDRALAAYGEFGP